MLVKTGPGCLKTWRVF